MIEINNTINLSLINLTNKSFKVDAGVYVRSVCEQMNNYFVRTGIIIVILYLFFCWFNWWFFNYGYKFKMFKYDKTLKLSKYIGDLNKLETRIYWDNFIKMRLLKLTIGYIVVVIYFNL